MDEISQEEHFVAPRCHRLIGITERHRAVPRGGTATVQQQMSSYTAAVADAGGVPVRVPVDLEEGVLRQVIGSLSGLVLPGGPDISPAAYGEPPHQQLRRVDDVLDATELALARAAVEADLPLLGICRGMQVLNVALGGTLVQDIPSQRPDALDHDRFRCRGYPPDDRAHAVSVQPSSRLAAILESAEVTTNSRHHQAIRTLAPALVAVAHTSDGLIEGVEIPGARFVLGVQWHPENLTHHPPMRHLFVELVRVASI